MEIGIVEVAILKRIFQVTPKPNRGGMKLIPPAGEGKEVHYIRIEPAGDDMFSVYFVTKVGNDAMAHGYFDDGGFCISGQQVCGWSTIDYLATSLCKINW
ncbi:hypothetical protein [Aeromonas veronii]|uniref:hypothetical protein n=2 Tax=Aeromonas TaxID=642 RepID=UPI002443E1AA|nr:hypothetical protein [Aeromonas veronii]